MGKLLDRAVDEAADLGIAFGEERVELLLADLLGGEISERIRVELAQRLAPLFEDRLKGALARPVADKALIVADLEVVAVDLHARQNLRAMRVEHRHTVSCS